jgi:hypothetical protein
MAAPLDIRPAMLERMAADLKSSLRAAQAAFGT